MASLSIFAQEPVFRAGVALVRVDVQVTDSRGRAVPGLAEGDFQVFDEGVPQKLSFFAHESEPLDVVLLLDVSGSMHRALQELASAAQGALKQLHEGDRVAVMLFARNSVVRREFTGDFAVVQADIRDAVRDNSLGAGTAINAAVIAAAEYIGKQPARGRRAILIVTDNTMLNFKVPDEDVMRALYRADTVLNGIIIGKQLHPDPAKPGTYQNPDFTPPDVAKLAELSGGEAMAARKVGEQFQEMIDRIRARYAMGYEAPAAAPGSFRRIRVELAPEAQRRHPRAAVHARAGYYVP